jgi:glycosyltransferase involved in cell wall biosynthesis
MSYLVDFIIPSFGDVRIVHAIDSIKNHKCADSFRIIVKDGFNKKSYTDFVLTHLRDSDILITNKDKGIFDALNIGLNHINADWVGWLGADDYLSSEFSIDFLNETSKNIISFSTFFFNENSEVIRVYKPCKSSKLRKIGFHLPHFSTFIRSKELTNHRFNLKYGIISDILFFLTLEFKNIDIEVHRNICSTYMQAGGTSNKSFGRIFKNNYNLFYYLKDFNLSVFSCVLFIFNKILYKLIQIKFINRKTLIL